MPINMTTFNFDIEFVEFMEFMEMVLMTDTTAADIFAAVAARWTGSEWTGPALSAWLQMVHPQ